MLEFFVNEDIKVREKFLKCMVFLICGFFFLYVRCLDCLGRNRMFMFYVDYCLFDNVMFNEFGVELEVKVEVVFNKVF